MKSIGTIIKKYNVKPSTADNITTIINLINKIAAIEYERGQDDLINEIKVVSVAPSVISCDGCRHVGTYDTDFPCSGCIRREKDYYEQE